MTTFLKTSIILFACLSFSCQAKTDSTVSLNTQYTALAEHPTPKHNNQFIKVALLLDTSNSMDGLIDQAKAQLWDIVNELSYAKCQNERPNLKIALYEYGNDNLSKGNGYVRQVLNFSSDLDDISKHLFSLTTNGGNEYCGQVIKTSLNDLEWGSNADDLKLIFIAGNEPFTQGQVSYKDAAMDAKEKDVTVNTIFCGNYTDGIHSYWKDGADLTQGDYMAINHNQQTVYVASPYDDEIMRLNTLLNKTYIAFGTRGQGKMQLQAEQDANAKRYSKANAVSRIVSKSTHLYKNSSWDLVDAAETEDFEISEIKDTNLPKELKGKSDEEISDYISKKAKERKTLQKQIQDLNSKRKVYIAKQQKTDNGLENAMIKAIKTQAKQKHYSWN